MPQYIYWNTWSNAQDKVDISVYIKFHHRDRTMSGADIAALNYDGLQKIYRDKGGLLEEEVRGLGDRAMEVEDGDHRIVVVQASNVELSVWVTVDENLAAAPLAKQVAQPYVGALGP